MATSCRCIKHGTPTPGRPDIRPLMKCIRRDEIEEVVTFSILGAIAVLIGSFSLTLAVLANMGSI